MPLLKMQVSTPAPVTAEQQAAVLAAASKIVATATGKPEAYVMVSLDPGAFSMSGQPAPAAAYLDVRAIGGLTPEVNGKLAKALCDLLRKEFGIPGDCVFISFIDVPATHWAWKGQTLG